MPRVISQEEQAIIEESIATSYREFLSDLQKIYPQLKFKFLRKKASRLWKAKLKNIKDLEPILCEESFYTEINSISNGCWGCNENQPNQLAHINYGGCLYDTARETGYIDSFPPLPDSPIST